MTRDFLGNALRLLRAKRKARHKSFVEEWSKIFQPKPAAQPSNEPPTKL